MAFRTNSSQQYSFSDTIYNLTNRERKALENSWAKVFSEEVFPAIDEERFRVLYSDRAQCRSNTPVNVIVGAMIIKEMFQISDDEVVENLMLDPRYQYALHTTSFDEQPLSDKSLSRFRKRCYDYETLHNVDLFHDCVADLSKKIAKMMGITPRIRRMDSMMIEANIRNLSRVELLYTCVAKVVIYLHKHGRDDLIVGLEHYYNPNDYNQIFYYSNSEETIDRLKAILDDADKLLKNCGHDFDDTTEYQLLVRCLSEQTIVDEGGRRLREKKDGGMASSMMQNPSDPDATFRTKAGKDYRGYAANLEESVGSNGSIVTDYQVEQNNYHDSRFFKDSINRNGISEEPSTIVADGAYCGKENEGLARENNVTLVTTAISGAEAPDIYADFELNEEGTRVLKCPAGHAPKSCSKGSNHLYVSFPRDVCLNCPHKDDCHVKVHKKVCSLTISSNAQNRARAKRMQGTEQFKLLARIRNGIETVPSILRHVYHTDRMPVRGLSRTGFFFGCKVAALNVRKLLTYHRGTGNYAQNPLLV
ncbi:MAG: transposase [Lachnospiraceae bacterium]|nr:transposase [Lachnospiraceae bacterium]